MSSKKGFRMRGSVKHFLLGATAVTAMLAVACGGGDTSDDDAPGDAGQRAVLATQNVTPTTDDEAAYFVDLQGAFDLFGTAAARASQGSLDLGTGDRVDFFAPLVNAGAGTAFLPVVERLRGIEPPPGYEADHALLVEQYEELARVDALLGESVREQDFVGFAIYNDQLGVITSRYLPQFSVNVCNVVSSRDPVCDVDRDDSYEAALAAHFLFVGPGEIPMGAIFGVALAPPDDRDTLSFVTRAEHLELISRLVDIARDFRLEGQDSLRAIDPPPEYADWHENLIVLGENALETLDEIQAAAAADDFVALVDLFFGRAQVLGEWEIGIPAGICSSLPFIEPCGHPESPDNEYEAALFEVTGQLLARTTLLGAVGPGRPGLLAESERSAIVANNRTMLIDEFNAALQAFDGLSPDSSALDDHQRIVEFVLVEIGLLEQQREAALAGDLLVIEEDGPEIAASGARLCAVIVGLSPERRDTLGPLVDINEDFAGCDGS